MGGHVEPEGTVSSLHSGDGACVGVGNALKVENGFGSFAANGRARARRRSRQVPRGRGHSRATHASPRARSKSSDARVRGAAPAAPCGQRCRPFGDRGRRGRSHGACRRELRVASAAAAAKLHGRAQGEPQQSAMARCVPAVEQRDIRQMGLGQGWPNWRTAWPWPAGSGQRAEAGEVDWPRILVPISDGAAPLRVQ